MSTPGRAPRQPLRQGSRKRLEPAARGAGAAEQDVGRAALAGDAATARRGRRPPRPAGGRRAPRRAGAAPASARSSLVGSAGGATHSTSSSAPEPLRGAPRAPDDRCALGGSTSASRRSPTAWASAATMSSRVPSGSRRPAARLDLLGDLAQRDLAQRAQVLDPEEVVQRRLERSPRVDLAGPQARQQRLGREVDSTTSSALVEHASGRVSRTRTPVSSAPGR